MPLERGASNSTFKRNVSEMRRSGYSRAQALAASYRQQRKSRRRRARRSGRK